MKASISVNAETNELIIRIPGADWKAARHGSFYEGETTVRELVNLVGGELTAELMRSQDVDVKRLELDGKTYYRKEASAGHYQTLYGDQMVER
ncbi:MAG: hypothetical protein ACREEM_16455, partial [Blastocatellia bacterium]